MKTCTKCLRPQPVSEFRVVKANAKYRIRAGLYSWCLECCRVNDARRRADPETKAKKARYAKDRRSKVPLLFVPLPRRPVTPYTDAQILLINTGDEFEVLATELGDVGSMSDEACESKIRQINPYGGRKRDYRYGPNKHTIPKIEEWIELYEGGASMRSIAHGCGSRPETVKRALVHAGVFKKKGA